MCGETISWTIGRRRMPTIGLGCPSEGGVITPAVLSWPSQSARDTSPRTPRRGVRGAPSIETPSNGTCTTRKGKPDASIRWREFGPALYHSVDRPFALSSVTKTGDIPGEMAGVTEAISRRRRETSRTRHHSGDLVEEFSWIVGNAWERLCRLDQSACPYSGIQSAYSLDWHRWRPSARA